MRPSLKFAAALPFTDRPSVVLINIYKTTQGRQEELLRKLETAARDVMRGLPGFISAAFHKGVDGVSIALYAEWESVDAWRGMANDETIAEAMKPVIEMSTCEPMLFDASAPIWPEPSTLTLKSRETV
jgi:heme-degrading monooxygenase HmoA